MAIDTDNLAAKNVVAWTNIGLLYFHHGDLELANEALHKAQTLDPDYALVWVGQGLVAIAQGQELEAKALFEHAVGLPADGVTNLPSSFSELRQLIYFLSRQMLIWSLPHAFRGSTIILEVLQSTRCS